MCDQENEHLRYFPVALFNKEPVDSYGYFYFTLFLYFRSRGDYSTIFTEPEENNCFSIIAQVIIRATAFSFILLISSLKTSRNRATAILKISASVL